jgi:hypothetical protein
MTVYVVGPMLNAMSEVPRDDYIELRDIAGQHGIDWDLPWRPLKREGSLHVEAC